MDVGAASALTLYNYQATLKTYGQGLTSSPGRTGSTSSAQGSAQDTAVLQALTSAYASLSSSPTGGLTAADPLATLAGSGGALGPLVSGIYSASAANGNTSSLGAGGGLEAGSASSLFPGNNAGGPGGLPASAINLQASLALAAYANHQVGIQSGTLGAVATAEAARIDPTQASSIQSALQGAQSANFTSTLNLLG